MTWGHDAAAGLVAAARSGGCRRTALLGLMAAVTVAVIAAFVLRR